MIITEDKKLPPVPQAGAASSSVSSFDGPDPPPYTPTDPTSPSASSSPPPTSSPRAAHDTDLDILSGDPTPYTTGPSVPPPPPERTPIPNLARHNHLHIYREHHPITENFVVDPRLPGPPGTTKKNLELETRYGPLVARVWVFEPGDLKGRVELSGTSERGLVKLAIADCAKTAKLHVTAGSESGPVDLSLPTGFTGPLTIRTKYGPISLSTSLRSHCRILEESSDVRRYWVSPGQSKEMDDEAYEEWRACAESGGWRGDECFVRTESGPIRVGYWTGVGVVEGFVEGLVKKIFGE